MDLERERREGAGEMGWERWIEVGWERWRERERWREKEREGDKEERDKER